MTIITNITEYEAASEEEQAVWLGEQLGIIISDKFGITGVPLEDLDTYSSEHYQGLKYRDEVTNWLASPEGVDAVERAMIAKKYECVTHAHPQGYAVSFEHTISGVYGEVNWSKTKADAQQHAAAKALLGEVCSG